MRAANYWKECTFTEIEGNILYCSTTEILFPEGIFRYWVPKVTSVKCGKYAKGHQQEYLVNNEFVFLIKGGQNWSVTYVSTLEEKNKQESEFGKVMLYRAQKSDMPWHIAKLTENIKSDEEAISLLFKIKKKAKKRNITPEQKYALRSTDLELRLVTLQLILGGYLWGIFKEVLKENETLSRYLAYYFAFNGKVYSQNLHHQCRIPKPIPIGYFNEHEHHTMMRTILSGTTRNLVKITDSIESDEEAIALLKEVKEIARKSNLLPQEILELKSEAADKRNSTLESILGEKIWSRIKEPVIESDNLSYFLGHFIRNKKSLKHFEEVVL